MSERRMRAGWWAVVVGLALALGCGDDAPANDAGPSDMDASVDASAPDTGLPDAGPICEAACSGGERCCADRDTGEASCVRLVDDIANCGTCGLDCVLTGRGDSCQAAQCACGDFLLGCVGSSSNTCCPAEPGGRDAHCANLLRDFYDCGECGNECDVRVADRCDGRRCVCGESRTGCAGTPEDTCCEFGADVGCVDTTRDPRNCGGCNVRCDVGRSCVDGACVLP